MTKQAGRQLQTVCVGGGTAPVVVGVCSAVCGATPSRANPQQLTSHNIT